MSIELRRLEDLTRVYWGKALSGDIESGQFLLKIMERRAKYLGLDHHNVTLEVHGETKNIEKILMEAEYQAKAIDIKNIMKSENKIPLEIENAEIVESEENKAQEK